MDGITKDGLPPRGGSSILTRFSNSAHFSRSLSIGERTDNAPLTEWL